MNSKDYEKLKLKIGIEIHQQMDTKKLFCNCPSTLRDDKPDFEIKRRMHASAGESGEMDVAAKTEMEKELLYIYQGYEDTTCAVELDEEPPHNLDNDALDIVLTFSKLVKAKVVPRIEIMRKIIANGSVTSGFQRTALVGVNGIIKNKIGDVEISNILLEEDACKDIEKKDGKVTYRLDRQGIPLIEISTDASIKTPEHAKEIAVTIGSYLRSIDGIKRGLGTIRQDLNISINNGNRIEIKGAQDLKNMTAIIDSEIDRQINLNKIQDELKEKNIDLEEISFDDFLKSSIIDITDVFSNCDSKVINNALSNGGVVCAIKLNGFKGYLGRELQSGRRLGSELSDYAKVNSGVGGIFHLDELPKYGIEQNHIDMIINKLNCNSDDTFVLCADQSGKVKKALYAAYNRARLTIDCGVIAEVRNVVKEISSAYMRPIPGAARMYPETDVESVIPDLKHIKLPELIDQKINRYKKLGLSEDLARDLARDYNNNLFESLLNEFTKLKPSSMAEKFLSIPKELRRKAKLDFEWNKDLANKLFKLWMDGQIDHASIYSIIVDMNTSKKDLDSIISNYKLLDKKQALIEIKKISDRELKKNSNLPKGALIGIIMRELKGKLDPKLVSDFINKN